MAVNLDEHHLLPVEFSAKAVRQLAHRRWQLEQNPMTASVVGEFEAEFRNKIGQIQRNPESGTVLKKNYRHSTMRTHGISVIYRVKRNAIRIYALSPRGYERDRTAL